MPFGLSASRLALRPCSDRGLKTLSAMAYGFCICFSGYWRGVFFSFVWLVFLGINYAWRSPQSHVYKAVVVDIYMKRAGRSVQHILLLRFVGNDVTYPLTATGSESQTVMVGDTCNLGITRGYLGYYIINGHEWQERYLEPMDSLPDLRHLIEY